jgi:hypothetical protein
MVSCEPVEGRVTANRDLDGRSVELVAAINDGDPTAFEVLYFRYRDWVAALAFRFTGDEHAALDVLQETILYVLRKLPGFGPSDDPSRPLYASGFHRACSLSTTPSLIAPKSWRFEQTA